MKYICKVSCATVTLSFVEGETVEINDELMAADLVNAGYMEPVEGETVEINDELMAVDLVNAGYMEPVEGETVVEKADTLNTAALENKKVSELKDICKNLGLETEGTKKEFIVKVK